MGRWLLQLCKKLTYSLKALGLGSMVCIMYIFPEFSLLVVGHMDQSSDELLVFDQDGVVDLGRDAVESQLLGDLTDSKFRRTSTKLGHNMYSSQLVWTLNLCILIKVWAIFT